MLAVARYPPTLPRGEGGRPDAASPEREPWRGWVDPGFAGAAYAATPSFFCRLVDEVVYWNSSFLSGYT